MAIYLVLVLCCCSCWCSRCCESEHLCCPPVNQPKPRYAVTIAVSSRTLFNMVAERKVYEEEGVEKYVAFQVENENEPLKPGAAFPFVKVRAGGEFQGCGLPDRVRVRGSLSALQIWNSDVFHYFGCPSHSSRSLCSYKSAPFDKPCAAREPGRC